MPIQIPSGQKTTSFLFKAESCLLGGILVLTDGTNAATVTVYDDNQERTTGKKVWQNTDAGTSYYGGGFFVAPILCRNGAYVVISGTGASCIVYEWVL
uniref:Uncharacterized protein n=1 Tax=viral metagenome TaxID=1070528 RepID=A0A6M3IHR8_9ZZZZ